MPAQEDLLKKYRPPPEEAYIEEVGGMLILRTKSGATAIVSRTILCEFAERYNLILVNYPACNPTSSSTQKHKNTDKKRHH